MDIGLDPSSRNLKQHGSFDLQMTVGSKTKEPSEATINITVIRCFDFLPPLLFFVFAARPFSGKALKKVQAHQDLMCFVAHNPDTTPVIA